MVDFLNYTDAHLLLGMEIISSVGFLIAEILRNILKTMRFPRFIFPRCVHISRCRLKGKMDFQLAVQFEKVMILLEGSVETSCRKYEPVATLGLPFRGHDESPISGQKDNF
jgi:hypothetical protein